MMSFTLVSDEGKAFLRKEFVAVLKFVTDFSRFTLAKCRIP